MLCRHGPCMDSSSRDQRCGESKTGPNAARRDVSQRRGPQPLASCRPRPLLQQQNPPGPRPQATGHRPQDHRGGHGNSLSSPAQREEAKHIVKARRLAHCIHDHVIRDSKYAWCWCLVRWRGRLPLQLGWALKHVAGNFSLSLFSPHPHQPSHGNWKFPPPSPPRLVSPSAHPPPPPPPLTSPILLPSIDGETEESVFNRLLHHCPAALLPSLLSPSCESRTVLCRHGAFRLHIFAFLHAPGAQTGGANSIRGNWG